MDADQFLRERDLYELDNGDDPMEWQFTAVMDDYLVDRLSSLLDELVSHLRGTEGIIDAERRGPKVNIATEGIDFTGVDVELRSYLEMRLRQIGELP